MVVHTIMQTWRHTGEAIMYSYAPTSSLQLVLVTSARAVLAAATVALDSATSNTSDTFAIETTGHAEMTVTATLGQTTDTIFMANMGNTSSTSSATISTTPTVTESPARRSTVEIVLWAILLVVILLTALVGNILVIVCVRTTARLREEKSNMFLVNLSITDIASAMVVMTASLHALVADRWHLGQVWCDLVCGANYMFIIVSMLTLCFISLDRYAAVVHALRYMDLVTRPRIRLLLAWAWFQGLCFGLAPVLAGWVRYDYWEVVCAIVWHEDSTNTLAYVVVAFAICFLLPGVVLSVAYCKVIKVAKAQNNVHPHAPAFRPPPIPPAPPSRQEQREAPSSPTLSTTCPAPPTISELETGPGDPHELEREVISSVEEEQPQQSLPNGRVACSDSGKASKQIATTCSSSDTDKPGVSGTPSKEGLNNDDNYTSKAFTEGLGDKTSSPSSESYGELGYAQHLESRTADSVQQFAPKEGSESSQDSASQENRGRSETTQSVADIDLMTGRVSNAGENSTWYFHRGSVSAPNSPGYFQSITNTHHPNAGEGSCKRENGTPVLYPIFNFSKHSTAKTHPHDVQFTNLGYVGDSAIGVNGGRKFAPCYGALGRTRTISHSYYTNGFGNKNHNARGDIFSPVSLSTPSPHSGFDFDVLSGPDTLDTNSTTNESAVCQAQTESQEPELVTSPASVTEIKPSNPGGREVTEEPAPAETRVTPSNGNRSTLAPRARLRTKERQKKQRNYSASSKAVKSLLIVVLAFFICMTPFSITKLYKVVFPVPDALPGYVNLVSTIFQYCSSVINPLIYGIFRKDFQRAFLLLFTKSLIKLRLREPGTHVESMLMSF